MVTWYETPQHVGLSRFIWPVISHHDLSPARLFDCIEYGERLAITAPFARLLLIKHMLKMISHRVICQRHGTKTVKTRSRTFIETESSVLCVFKQWRNNDEENQSEFALYCVVYACKRKSRHESRPESKKIQSMLQLKFKESMASHAYPRVLLHGKYLTWSLKDGLRQIVKRQQRNVWTLQWHMIHRMQRHRGWQRYIKYGRSPPPMLTSKP